MKKHFHIITLLSLFFLNVSLSKVSAQSDLSSVNFVYQYDPKGELFVNYRISNKANTDSLELICQLVLNDAKASVTNYHFSVYQASSYKEKLVNQVPVNSSFIGSRGNSHFWSFSFAAVEPSKILVLEIVSSLSQIRYYYDIISSEISPIRLADQSKVPIVKSWLQPDEFCISQRPGTALYYAHDFKPALPPMVTRNPAPGKELKIDSMFSIVPSNRFALRKPGLNLLQKDTSDVSGLTILSVDKYFPKAAKLDQLIAPLIYITTKEEWIKLASGNVEKKDFDKFWMDMTKSQTRAKKIIKVYYDRVEEANQFFTTYKEGWKTDKGLIYIVFGLPDQITRIGDKEIWRYDDSQEGPMLEFEFLRVNSVFSAQHYVLIREKKYANAWFRGVNTLRKVRF
ncbi:GWxTD domain-containing protein [Fulvivirga sp. M361]|uniref:GWxTD domain-containing protein n=1 Tax=Fulvivirga sp. M361 TaxID=2594266 RepID=UPI00117A1CA2|nr:GWxTD domain-containing protein [Fulvivirga sp. M361]TRX53708.1 GWxTD domain-containing protein [Fulvivirga sp. M361]